MNNQNDFLLDTEDEEKDKETEDTSPKDNGSTENEDDEPSVIRGPFGNLTKEEMEKRGFELKTIRFTPFDLVLVLISLGLFTLSGCGMAGLSLLAIVVSAPVYATFSYRIGNNFSFFIPIAAIIASGFITRSPIMPLGTLLATAMAYIMLYCVNNRLDGSKKSAVVGCCCAMALYLVAAFIVSDIMGKISLRELLTVIDEMFTELEAYTYEMYAGFSDAGLDFGLTDADLRAVAKQFAQSTRALIPSAIITSFMFLSYISASLLPLIARICGAKELLADTKYEIKLSRICVVVYFLSWICAFLGSGIFGYAFKNITSILAPALAICGIKQIGDFFTAKGMPKILALLIQALSIFIAFIFGDIGLSALIMFGAFKTLKDPVTDINS